MEKQITNYLDLNKIIRPIRLNMIIYQFFHSNKLSSAYCIFRLHKAYLYLFDRRPFKCNSNNSLMTIQISELENLQSSKSLRFNSQTNLSFKFIFDLQPKKKYFCRIIFYYFDPASEYFRFPNFLNKNLQNILKSHFSRSHYNLQQKLDMNFLKYYILNHLIEKNFIFIFHIPSINRD